MKKKINKKIGERFNPYKTFNGVFIPEAIVSIPVKKLSQGAKLAYGRLCRYAGKNGLAYPRRETLAEEIGCKVRQVDSYLNQLKRFGLLEAVRIGLGKPNEYYFIWHEIFDSPYENADSLKQNKAVTDLPQQHESESQNVATPSIKESHSKRVKERENTANAESLINGIKNQSNSSTDIESLVVYYQQKISSAARLTTKAEKILEKRFQEFTYDELIKAIDNFSQQPWHMKNNSHQGLAWFFQDEDKVLKWISMVKPQGAKVHFA